MAGFFNNFFKDVGRGFVDGFFGNDYVRDYKHASKTFRTNAYGYAPKFKYLFHVYFDLNDSQIGLSQSLPNDKNFGLAVKSIDLPKYSMALTDMNQYNRHRYIQTKINYDPITIRFHDDNNNLVRQLWYLYMTYYYKDSTQPDPATGLTDLSGALNAKQFDINKRNIYEPSIEAAPDWGYIGESTRDAPPPGGGGYQASTKTPFFRSISVFSFNQHNFTQYKLINPIIESFSHDSHAYSETTGTMENTMTMRYEGVKYFQGALNGSDPSALVNLFGREDHYDRQLSPIARPGANRTILGQGGLVDAAGGVLSDLQKGNILGAIQTAGVTLNTFKNGGLKSSAIAELTQAAVTAAGSTTRDAARSGKFNFPVAGATNMGPPTPAANPTTPPASNKPPPVVAI